MSCNLNNFCKMPSQDFSFPVIVFRASKCSCLPSPVTKSSGHVKQDHIKAVYNQERERIGVGEGYGLR